MKKCFRMLRVDFPAVIGLVKRLSHLTFTLIFAYVLPIPLLIRLSHRSQATRYIQANHSYTAHFAGTFPPQAE